MKPFPPIKPFGLPTAPAIPGPKPVQGKDFPAGIDDLELSWFESRFNVDRVAAATTPDALRVLQAQADFVLWLKTLQQLSKEA